MENPSTRKKGRKRGAFPQGSAQFNLPCSNLIIPMWWVLERKKFETNHGAVPVAPNLPAIKVSGVPAHPTTGQAAVTNRFICECENRGCIRSPLPDRQSPKVTVPFWHRLAFAKMLVSWLSIGVMDNYASEAFAALVPVGLAERFLAE